LSLGDVEGFGFIDLVLATFGDDVVTFNGRAVAG
jgi:hypothetical protein